jgi:hypothetical protein
MERPFLFWWDIASDYCCRHDGHDVPSAVALNVATV